MSDRTLLERLAAKGKLPEAAPLPTHAETAQSFPERFTVEHHISAPAMQSDEMVQLIDLALIDIESQIRTCFDDNYIVDLALDFVASGLMQPKQPITVFQRNNGRYLLDAGENRIRAMRYAASQREAMGVKDTAAFTAIRATVLGLEPDKLSRLQSQARENLLHDALNDIDLARAVKQFLDATPGATHTDAANWLGFVNVKSGRVRVHNALKLLQCDDDLVDAVRAGKLAASRALTMQTERNAQSAAESTSSSATSVRPKAVPLPFDAVQRVSEILLAVAQSNGIELLASDAELTRETVKKLFAAPELTTLLDRLRQ